jgi:hypothetical protein
MEIQSYLYAWYYQYYLSNYVAHAWYVLMLDSVLCGVQIEFVLLPVELSRRYKSIVKFEVVDGKVYTI